MRSRPSISARYSISVARSAIAPVRHRAAIGVDVLAEQRDFADALVGEIGDFGQHVVERPRNFLAARVRNDAERAILAAAFHDRHEGRGAVDARRRKVVEFLDLRKADVDLRLAGCAPARDQFAAAGAASAARRRRRRTGARSTIVAPSWLATQPPTPMMSSGIGDLELAHATEVVEHALLRLFAHRAGVEQDDVGVRRATPSARDPRRRAGRRPSCPSRTRSSGSQRCGCTACGSRGVLRRAPASR